MDKILEIAKWPKNSAHMLEMLQQARQLGKEEGLKEEAELLTRRRNERKDRLLKLLVVDKVSAEELLYRIMTGRL